MVSTTAEEVKEVDGQVVRDSQKKRSSEAPLSGSLGWERVKSERVEPEKVKNHFRFLFNWECFFFRWHVSLGFFRGG